MHSGLKKVVFSVIVLMLIGWAWYVSQNTGSGSMSNFDKAVKIMEDLQSRAVQTELTSDQMATLETAYIEAQERKPRVQAFRDADVTKLTQRLTQLSVPTAQKTELTNLVKQRKDVYAAAIEGIMDELDITDAEKTEIKKLADSIISMSEDVRLTTLFIGWYAGIRQNICTTNGPTFDIYTQATIGFKYRATTISDTCESNNTKVKEVRCAGFIYDTENPLSVRSTTCTYGCNTGKCIKWTLGTAAKAYKTATTTTEETDVDLNEAFYLRLTPAKASDATGTLTVEVTSPAFTGNKCTLTTKSDTIGWTAAMNFGPILCQIPGNHIFTFTLKDGDTTIGTLPKTMTIGSVAMKEFQFINPPTTVVKDTDVSLTVQTLGTNDEPYPNYNKKFFILVEGDDDRTIPEAWQSMNGSSTKTLSGIKFSQAGSVIVTIRSEDSLFQESVTITVTDA